MQWLEYRFTRYLCFLLIMLAFSSNVAIAKSYSVVVLPPNNLVTKISSDFTEVQQRSIQQWLQAVTASLMTVYGELPQDKFEFVINAYSDGKAAVPWGQVNRGKIIQLELYVDPDATYQQLISDWTAFHELSHLFLPYQGYGDVWFSEGIATYYQNIIQARAAFFDEHTLWHKLNSGFRRGDEQQAWADVSLSVVSDNNSHYQQFMRVYWSGVLYWLSADVELKRQGKHGLDSALKKLKHCCQHQAMSARQIASKLDEITNSHLFVSQLNNFAVSKTLPEYQNLLSKLGVLNQGGEIQLTAQAPLAQYRHEIFTAVQSALNHQ